MGARSSSPRSLSPKNGGGPLHGEPARMFKLPPGKRPPPTYKIVALHLSDCSVKLLLPFLSQLSDKITVNTSVSFCYACH